MPELPEVETVRRQLDPAMRGRAIVEVWIDPTAPSLLRGLTPEQFRDAVRGRRIERLRRRGKWLILDLAGGISFVVHLRMTGRLLHRRPLDPPDPYEHARLLLDDGSQLRWCDVRKFGTWDLVLDPSEVTGAIGPEPLDEAFDARALLAAAAGRRASIKSVLLDQRRIAGLGNIYVDEALWRAGIHPQRPAGSITAAEAARLQPAIVAVLLESLESGGSTLRDYRDAAGRRGSYQTRWQVYKREGEPCYSCGADIVRIVVGGRGTRYCPGCQTLDAQPATPQTADTDS